MDFNAIISKYKTGLHLTGKGRGDENTGAGLNKNKTSLSKLKEPILKIIGKYSYNYEKVLGLEISPHYIRICQMTNSYGKWSLNHLASVCMESQFSNSDIEANQDLYVESLKSLLETHHIKTKDVALSIPTSASIIKILNIPDMEPEDLDQAASMGGIWESMVQLSGPIHEYAVYYKILRRKIKPSESFSINEAMFAQQENSYQTTTSIISSLPDPIENLPAIIAEPSQEDNTMDVLFVATKFADAMLYAGIAQSAGLNPIIMDSRCNAIKHAFETNPEKQHINHPYAFLEFGEDENYIYVVEDINVSIFHIIISDEEKLLIRQGFETPEALQNFVNNYALQLKTILNTYKKGDLSKEIYNIFVSSNTPLHVDDASSEPLINVFVREISLVMGSYKITPCTFCNHIEVPAQFAKKVNAEGNLTAWAAVLGLATYKLDIFGYQKDSMAIDLVNFMPGYLSIIRTRATQVISTLAMAVVFAFVIITAGATFLAMSAKNYSLASDIKTLEPIKAQYEEKNQELNKLNMFMDKVKSLDKVRSTLPSNQMQIINIYKIITSSIPEGVWLIDVTFSPTKMPDVKEVNNGKNYTTEIRGNSINDQNILEFVKKLNDAGGFKKIYLKKMEAIDKKDKSLATSAAEGDKVKKFTLQGELEVDASTKKLELLAGGAK